MPYLKNIRKGILVRTSFKEEGIIRGIIRTTFVDDPKRPARATYHVKFPYEKLSALGHCYLHTKFFIFVFSTYTLLFTSHIILIVIIVPFIIFMNGFW